MQSIQQPWLQPPKHIHERIDALQLPLQLPFAIVIQLRLPLSLLPLDDRGSVHPARQMVAMSA